MCAARISFTIDNVNQDTQAVLQKKGPYTQTSLASEVVDKEARIVYLNESYCQMIELVGRGRHPSDYERPYPQKSATGIRTQPF